MPTYVSLINYTDQGVQHFKEIGSRLEHARQGAAELGITISSFHLTMGRYDAIVIFDAPDAETAARLALINAANGRVRTETLAAFTEDETVALAERLPI